LPSSAVFGTETARAAPERTCSEGTLERGARRAVAGGLSPRRRSRRCRDPQANGRINQEAARA